MVSGYASRLARSVIYRRRLVEQLPDIEAGLSAYMLGCGLEKIRVNGYWLERLDDGRLDLYEAGPVEDGQLEFELRYKELGMPAEK